MNSTSDFLFFKQQVYSLRGCAPLTKETSSLLRIKSITQVASPLDIRIANFAFSHNLFPEFTAVLRKSLLALATDVRLQQ